MTAVALDLRPIAGHLRRMLADHWAWCRTNGVPWPPGLDDLGQILASAGQDGTALDALDGLGDAAGVLLIDYDEVARRLGISRRTVQRLVSTGELPVVALGRQRRVHVEDLAAFADALRRPDMETRTR